ncbi:MAG TPA: HEPN domain-containing protein [Phycisphaerae bacterium]|nr:HEPN domain-containing protein [Phycisphaerae bacterium]
MKESTAKLLDKSERSISAGDSLLAGGHVEAAANRAYYAMFYVAEALLGERGLRFRKHGGVHGAFGEHFVKTGLFDPQYHRWLLAAFNKRITADYGVDAELTVSEVAEMLAQAREFLAISRGFLNAAQP